MNIVKIVYLYIKKKLQIFTVEECKIYGLILTVENPGGSFRDSSNVKVTHIS